MHRTAIVTLHLDFEVKRRAFSLAVFVFVFFLRNWSVEL